MSNGRKKTGRPTVTIDWAKVDEMLAGFSPGAEIAGVLGIHHDTLYDACVREKGIAFSDYAAEKRKRGENLLRKAQLKNAIENNNTTMQIWLGKQYILQREPPEKTTAEYTEEQVTLIKSIFAEIAKLQENNKPKVTTETVIPQLD